MVIPFVDAESIHVFHGLLQYVFPVHHMNHVSWNMQNNQTALDSYFSSYSMIQYRRFPESFE